MKMKISDNKVWLKYYSKEALSEKFPQCTAYQYLRERNKDRLDKPALHYYGSDITHRELWQRIEECASAFVAMGVKKGDIVSFLSVAVPETIAAVYALNKIGAAANTIDPRMDINTIKKMINASDSNILVTIDVAFPKVEKIKNEINPDIIIVQSAANSLPFFKKIAMKLAVKTNIEYSDNLMKWSTFLSKGEGVKAEEVPYEGDATVAITYTGGTTGIPKGTMLTNDSMNAVVINFMYCDAYMNDNDRYLGIIPIFSAYGMVCGMHMPLCMRHTLVPIPKFVPNTIGKLVKQFKPQVIISTPVFIELLINSKEVKNMDLSFLYTLASGGDTMNEGLEKKLNEFMKEHNMKFPLAQGYGMTELSAAASFCVNTVYKRGSVGIPSLTTTVSIFDPETGEELGYNEIGEVCVTGPSMMKGYFNAKEETDIIMRKHDDGQMWIHSGDIGYMDDDGFLFIKGRIKRMITRFDGHKVFPINMEGLISGRKEVKNCSVIGVNDKEHSQGQYPLAIVELVPGVDKETACAEIFAYCDEQLEERGKPVAVLSMDEIPLTGMGKNDAKALEAIYSDFDYTSWNPKADK
ncbi:MAG: acyl--CoA ligase [Ruminococcus sp.]|nr:acyl--CoA ligase [Ruminococcus sp.]